MDPSLVGFETTSLPLGLIAQRRILHGTSNDGMIGVRDTARSLGESGARLLGRLARVVDDGVGARLKGDHGDGDRVVDRDARRLEQCAQ